MTASNVLNTKFGQLILSKIIKIDATRCHILRLKCTKLDFGWGPPQTPLEELTALPRPASWIWGPFRGRGVAGLGKRRGKWRGGKGRAPKLLLNQGPSEPCYATAQTHNWEGTAPRSPDPTPSLFSIFIPHF